MRTEFQSLLDASNNFLLDGGFGAREVLEQEVKRSQNTLRKNNLSFSDALYALREGACVQREGWNGKGMHIFLEEHFTALINMGGRKLDRKYEPVICLWTAQKTTQPGWLPSQQDLLANDWTII